MIPKVEEPSPGRDRPQQALPEGMVGQGLHAEAARRRTGPLRAAWAFLLIALLLGEVLGLTFRFDTGSLASNDAWWARLLGEAYSLPQLVVVIALATFLFGAARLRAHYHHLARCNRTWPVWPFLLGHLAAFAAFAWLTALLLGGETESLPYPLALVVGWLLLAGLTLALWAAALLPGNLWLPLVRQGAVPLLAGTAIGVLAWGAGRLTDRLWLPLNRGTFWVVRTLLGLFVTDPVCEPAAFVVGTQSFRVRISPECSGYEGIGLIWVFLGAYLWFSRNELRFPRALLVLPLATVVIWFVNAIRITSLIALGTWGSPAMALGGFHSQAGWLAFNAVALATVVLVQRLRFFHRGEMTTVRGEGSGAPAPIPRSGEATPAYLVPLLVLLATMMVTGAFSTGFDYLYPARVMAVGATLFYYRRRYAGLFRSGSWQAVAIGVAVFVVWLALEPAAAGSSGTAGVQFPAALTGMPAGWAAVWLAFRVVGSVVTVPLAEELAFRGYLLRRLQVADFEAVPLGRFTWLSFLASSVLFGLLHGRWLAGTLAGMFYALALYRRRDLAEPVLAHAVTNALIAAHVLATGAWSLWA